MALKNVQTTEQEVAVLKSRLAKQDAELYELRQQLRRAINHSGGAPAQLPLQSLLTHPCGDSRARHDSGRSPLPKNLPSFARPTRASRLRNLSPTSDTEPTAKTGIKQSSNKTGLNGSEHVINDQRTQAPLCRNGKLIKRRFGYLITTKSTLSRFGWNEQQREERCGVRHSSLVESWEAPSNGAWGTPEDAASVASSQPPEPTQTMTQDEFERRTERQSIAARTRLSENGWAHKPENNVLLDHDESSDIGTKGEKLAKRCLYKWLRVNRHEKCKMQGLHCLLDMDLGRSRVNDLYEDTVGFFDYRDTTSGEVTAVLDDLVLLRNRIHHFDGSILTAPILDGHLYSAQLLSVLLYDEETAEMVRDLRDRLRYEAEGIIGEVEAVRLFAALPFCGGSAWLHHHLEMFEKVDRALEPSGDEYIQQNFSPYIIAAALKYHSDRGDATEWDCEPDAEEILANREEGLARVEESLANVRRLEKSGHGKETLTRLERQRGL